MRKLILWDIRFQIRYGFYFLYAVLTLLYLFLLQALPASWQHTAAILLIFSDPAAMGLFFMGAMLLLEKSQRITPQLAVSPVTVSRYISSKIISLMSISLVVAFLLSFPFMPNMIFFVLLGTAISSVIFSLTGLIIASKISSLNQFILWTVPVETICFIPAIMISFSSLPSIFDLFPIVPCFRLLYGQVPTLLGWLGILIGITLLYRLCHQCIKSLFQSQGGGKL